MVEIDARLDVAILDVDVSDGKTFDVANELQLWNIQHRLRVRVPTPHTCRSICGKFPSFRSRSMRPRFAVTSRLRRRYGICETWSCSVHRPANPVFPAALVKSPAKPTAAYANRFRQTSSPPSGARCRE